MRPLIGLFKHLRIRKLDVLEELTYNGVSIAGGIVVGTGEVVDLNGEADALIMDAAQNVRLDGSSTGKLRIKISGAYDFEALANIFRMLSGSVLETNTINETTAASGVTIDGVLIKDGGAVFADAATIEIDTINEATAAAGVTIDGVLVKDGAVTARRPVIAVTADGAIAVPNGDTTYHITKAGVAAMTLVDPTTGTHDGLRLTFIADTANAHTLDLVTGINGGAADVGTFGGAVGDGVIIEAYLGEWFQVPGGNTNVTFA